MTAKEIEVIVAQYFGWRRNIIVPNASWGVGLHECDLLVLSERNFATEVEIKISRADLKADQKKSHGHNSIKIKNLWFAVPYSLIRSALELCPSRAGILAIRKERVNCWWGSRFRVLSQFQLRCDDATPLELDAYRFMPATPIGDLVTVVRKPQPEPGAKSWTQQERLHLAEIGLMRYWSRRDSVGEGA